MSSAENEKAGIAGEKTSAVIHQLESGSKYRIDHYDQMPAFASFLPGIAGKEGVPLWCMYVNRGQAVASFGVANKDNAIAEFLSATWAYQLVGIQGFRTFCKIKGNYYEPFQIDAGLLGHDQNYSRTMSIESDRLKLQEINRTLGICFTVEYFSPVNQPIGSLLRLLTITNVAQETQRFEAMDGLAVVVPAGLTDYGIKHMRRLNEAYCGVRLVKDFVPFYSAKVLAHDEAEVTKVTQGNFYASWICSNSELIPVEPLVDPDVIFGSGNNLITPRLFITESQIDRSAQVLENRLPCAFAPFEATLKPGESIKLIAAVGFARTDKILEKFLTNFQSIEYIENCSEKSRQTIDSAVAPAFMLSESSIFDAYVKQSFLDNVLRGGIPELFPSKSGAFPLYIYSRRHGDLERDYNYFELPPNPLSSGPGNYRDICQNRRHDIWFYPNLFDQEIRMFVELLQADGYNPLAVAGHKWKLAKDLDPQQFCPTQNVEAQAEFCRILGQKFLPGDLLDWANLYGASISDRMDWLRRILQNCDCELVASGHEGGYWIDHWTYITDLLEAFAGIYPDKVTQMLTSRANIGWFYEGAFVVPRSRKSVMKPCGLVQLNSVIDCTGGARRLPPVTVFGKLCSLLAIKAVSFDYECKGIEMEAGRPAWNDALNGLPGMFGSSTCEAAELLRMTRWLQEFLPDPVDTEFPLEVADFLEQVIENLETAYNWDRATTIRETFRDRIRSHVSAKSTVVTGSKLKRLLSGICDRATRAIGSSLDPETGLIHTYYKGQPTKFKIAKKTNDSGTNENPQFVEIEEFNQQPLPLYLEGQVHWLRLVDSTQKARQIYKAVSGSSLYDQALMMYKLNECLHEWPHEIGRARTFTRGWFENESIWLHMSYKYLVEILRVGLYEEFFEDARTMLVPFMNPEVYGRSILENSSFLASSACPDPKARGRGFVARLSGSTAEFIHIWLLLTVGDRPFYQEDGKLCFGLKPVLPAAWFTRQAKTANWNGQKVQIPANSLACALLGTILLVYHNDSRKNTFGPSHAKPIRYVFDGVEGFETEYLESEAAERIRNRYCKRLDVWLG
jgi:hypothetical protein